MAKTKKRGGEKAPRFNLPARKGSVAEFKSWCLSSDGKRVIRKTQKAMSEMTQKEKEEFCPPEEGSRITSSPPPASARTSMSESPQDPMLHSEPEVEDPPLVTGNRHNEWKPLPVPSRYSALDRLKERKTVVPAGIISASTYKNPTGYYGVHRAVSGTARRKRSRKHKRKTHRRRR